MQTKKTAQFFDSYASDFDSIYGNKNNFFNKLVNKYFRQAMRMRFVKTINGCQPIQDKTAIDIGCGPGHYSIALARKNAKFIYGIDFAEGMIDLARRNASSSGVEKKCRFEVGDFVSMEVKDKFDYAIVMGLMDYVDDPKRFIEKVIAITKSRAFFSFPADGGFLAWQRKLRYKRRCNLYMYRIGQLHELFMGIPCKNVEFERISRDIFVTVSL